MAKNRRTRKKNKRVSAFFRAFLISSLLIICAAAVGAGIFFADSGIRKDLGEDAVTVFRSKEIPGGYSLEIFGVRTTLGGEWTIEFIEILKKGAVLIPPECRIILELFE